MSRSILWPLILGALILVLVAASQAGVTADEEAKAMAAALESLRMVGAPLLAAGALFLWLRQRDPGMGFLALGLVVTGLLVLFRLPGWQLPAFYLYPLHLLGVALAAILWAEGGLRNLSGLARLLVGSLAALMAVHWLYMAAAHRFPPGIHAGVGVNLLQALHFGLFTALCWTGNRRHGDRRLLWLAGFGLVQALLMVITTASIFVPLLQGVIPRLLYPGLVTLPLVMEAGALLAASRPIK